jgi:hypothetical protein
MTDWINAAAIWRIVAAGLVFGAGIPTLFGIGLRLLSTSTATSGRDDRRVRPDLGAPVVLAALCFAVVLATAGWGVYLIVAGR